MVPRPFAFDVLVPSFEHFQFAVGIAGSVWVSGEDYALSDEALDEYGLEEEEDDHFSIASANSPADARRVAPGEDAKPLISRIPATLRTGDAHDSAFSAPASSKRSSWLQAGQSVPATAPSSRVVLGEDILGLGDDPKEYQSAGLPSSYVGLPSIEDAHQMAMSRRTLASMSPLFAAEDAGEWDSGDGSDGSEREQDTPASPDVLSHHRRPSMAGSSSSDDSQESNSSASDGRQDSIVVTEELFTKPETAQSSAVLHGTWSAEGPVCVAADMGAGGSAVDVKKELVLCGYAIVLDTQAVLTRGSTCMSASFRHTSVPLLPGRPPEQIAARVPQAVAAQVLKSACHMVDDTARGGRGPPMTAAPVDLGSALVLHRSAEDNTQAATFDIPAHEALTELLHGISAEYCDSSTIFLSTMHQSEPAALASPESHSLAPYDGMHTSRPIPPKGSFSSTERISQQLCSAGCVPPDMVGSLPSLRAASGLNAAHSLARGCGLEHHPLGRKLVHYLRSALLAHGDRSLAAQVSLLAATRASAPCTCLRGSGARPLGPLLVIPVSNPALWYRGPVSSEAAKYFMSSSPAPGARAKMLCVRGVQSGQLPHDHWFLSMPLDASPPEKSLEHESCIASAEEKEHAREAGSILSPGTRMALQAALCRCSSQAPDTLIIVPSRQDQHEHTAINVLSWENGREWAAPGHSDAQKSSTVAGDRMQLRPVHSKSDQVPDPDSAQDILLPRHNPPSPRGQEESSAATMAKRQVADSRRSAPVAALGTLGSPPTAAQPPAAPHASPLLPTAGYGSLGSAAAKPASWASSLYGGTPVLAPSGETKSQVVLPPLPSSTGSTPILKPGSNSAVRGDMRVGTTMAVLRPVQAESLSCPPTPPHVQRDVESLTCVASLLMHWGVPITQ